MTVGLGIDTARDGQPVGFRFKAKCGGGRPHVPWLQPGSAEHARAECGASSLPKEYCARRGVRIEAEDWGTGGVLLDAVEAAISEKLRDVQGGWGPLQFEFIGDGGVPPIRCIVTLEE